MSTLKEELNNLFEDPLLRENRIHIETEKDKSSNIQSIAWQMNSGKLTKKIETQPGTLTIAFIPNNAKYNYFNVSGKIFMNFAEAKSLGQYFTKYIKPKFKYEKI